MSKTHDAVQQLEGALPTLFDRMLSVLGLMRTANQEVAALHSDSENDEIDSEAVLSQVKNITSLSDQLAAAITEAKGATTAAVQAVKAGDPNAGPAPADQGTLAGNAASASLAAGPATLAGGPSPSAATQVAGSTTEGTPAPAGASLATDANG